MLDSYRKDIDGLRAIAVIAVVIGHAGLSAAAGGFVGVDVFFVISGFLITALLVDEAAVHGRINLWRFYARRVRRLAPAFLLVALSTLVLAAMLLTRVGGEIQGVARSIGAALLLNANHYYWLTSGSYFARTAEQLPYLHTWSLSVEEQFYLVWPLLLILLLRLGTRAGFTRRVRVGLVAGALASFIPAVWLSHAHPSAAFYLMPMRGWELAIGGLIAVMGPVGESRGKSGAVLAALGLAAIAASIGAFSSATVFPGLAALLPVAGAAALIAGNGWAPGGLVARLLSWAPMRLAGRISYPWYLWHWPLLAIARARRLGEPDATQDFILAAVVAPLLAYATYRWVETPVRNGAAIRGWSARRTVGAGALASLACVGLALAVGGWAKYGNRTPAEQSLIDAAAERPPLQARCLADTDRDPLRKAALMPVADCATPIADAPVEVLLWGDSMADQMLLALATALGPRGTVIYQATRSYCPPLVGGRSFAPNPVEIPECNRFQELVLVEAGRLRALGQLKAVVLAAAWVRQDPEDLRRALDATLDRLGASGVRVLLIAPTPKLGYSPPECLARRPAADCALLRAEFDAQSAAAMQVLAEAVRGRSGVRLVDPTAFLCDAEACPAIRAGTVLYTDWSHISTAASRALGAWAHDAIEWSVQADGERSPR